jgi:hypothetical protein
MSGYASLADFAERLSKLSAKGNGTAVFYSTTTDNEEAAQDCTERYPGRYYTWRDLPGRREKVVDPVHGRIAGFGRLRFGARH